MAISPLPDPPSRGDPTNFAPRADAFMAALPHFAEEANALQEDVNAKQATASDAATTASAQAANAANSATAAVNAATAAANSAYAAGTADANAAASAAAADQSRQEAEASAASVDRQALSTDYYGDTPPAITWPGMRWAHESADLLKRRNAADTDWIVVDYLTMSLEDRRWASFPIGHLEPVRDDLTGVAIPPIDNQHFRYIKLTAADAYNAGVLTSESVSGSAPKITATAVVSLAGSPLNGRTVNLLNTERRMIRPGNSGVLADSSSHGHQHEAPVVQSDGGTMRSVNTTSFGTGTTDLGISAVAATVTASGKAMLTSGVYAGSVSGESSPRNIGATYYMRVK